MWFVGMGVDAQMGAAGRRKGQGCCKNAVAGAVAAQPVDGGVRFIADPGAVNGGVGGVLPRHQGKGGAGRVPVTQHIELLLGDVLPQQFGPRVGGPHWVGLPLAAMKARAAR